MDTTEVKPFRWSFSQWETYNECPAKWNYRSVMKLPSSPPGPAAARGLEMHDRAEQYIIGQRPDLVPPATRFGGKAAVTIHPKYIPVLDAFKDHENGDRYTERKVGFDDEWYLCGSHKSSSASCIAVLDAVRAIKGVVYVGEWKSGQMKNTHADQRKMYALAALRIYNVDEVQVTTYYFEDTAPPQRLVVSSSAEQKLKDLWNGRVNQMKTDKILAPKPGMGCRWCDYSKSKGGPCQFSA